MVALASDVPAAEHAHWHGELAALRQSSLRACGVSLLIGGYVWTFALALIRFPRFAGASLALPVATAGLGALVLALRGPTAKGAAYAFGVACLCTLCLFVGPPLVAPFTFALTAGAAALAWRAAASFLLAAVSTVVLLVLAPPLGSQVAASSVLVPAAVLCWLAAAMSWLSTRNLHVVLSWALRGYEESWSATRKLRKQQATLRRTMRDLADANALLKRTSHDLALAREEAEQSGQLKSRFAANISHELRTPLQIIVGFSQVMHVAPEKYRGASWTPELRGDIQEIYDAGQHLLRLIDDVLDLSQIEAVRLPLSKETMSLSDVIGNVADTFGGLLRRKGLHLRLELPEALPWIYADPTRVRQVLLNLLNNAARFTHSGGVTISALVRETDVEVAVADTGVGIPEQELQRIFEEFHQADMSLRRRYDGSGLGLAIARQFVHLHGGTIWAESTPGVGSTFHFTLPLPDTPVVLTQVGKVPTDWQHPAARAKLPHHVLTLSEPASFVRFLQGHLPQVEVTIATSAEGLVPLSRSCQPDAVIIQESSLSTDALSSLVEAVAERLPVVSCAVPSEAYPAIASEATYWLAKPFAGDQLLGVLHRCCPDARRVLVVDDDPGVVRLIERLVASPDGQAHVIPAYDAGEALRKLEQGADAILLDIGLPDVSGLSLLQGIRADERLKDIPVIVITAREVRGDPSVFGQGRLTVLRGCSFSAQETARWLETVLEAMPARYLTAVTSQDL